MTTFVERLFGILLLFLGLGSCTAALAPFGTEEALRLDNDEKRIWNRAKEEQKRLDNSGQIYQAAALTAYVNEVAAKITPEPLKQKGLSFQIKIIKNPLLNAFAFPHGVIYIHTGMLARMENEAQLAAILGHEMNHVVRRHMVQQIRAVQNAAGTLSALQVVLLPLGAVGSIGQLLGAVGAVAAVSGYSKAAEEESDREGLAWMVAAGYDPREAPKLFDYLKRDIEELKKDEPFFFGSHPRVVERQDSYNRLLQTRYRDVKGIAETERFMDSVLLVLLDNAAMDLSFGRFALAQETIEKFLKRQPDSARAYFTLGEVYRQRNQKDDVEKAEKHYRQASQFDAAYAPPYRGLGLIWLKQGHKKQAREAFEKYLSLAPQAEDKGYIQQYLQDLPSSEANAS
ncbi:MAG: hypothetical protein A3F90_08730 [Deltaproteobacteria bacterium RIFCSPLOWO2_12_FULL_60_19]|nr:MAG: hypothetical protein A3F90_08730 [Deltaproteobacteria bacterium RIFCSPLOWO2_12_FULL_60_19]